MIAVASAVVATKLLTCFEHSGKPGAERFTKTATRGSTANVTRYNRVFLRNALVLLSLTTDNTLTTVRLTPLLPAATGTAVAVDPSSTASDGVRVDGFGIIDVAPV